MQSENDVPARLFGEVPMPDLRLPQPDYPHVWHWKSHLPERKGQACKVIAQGAKNTVLVEFTDGFRVTTSRYAVRRAS